jgi:hypothetical protein
MIIVKNLMSLSILFIGLFISLSTSVSAETCSSPYYFSTIPDSQSGYLKRHNPNKNRHDYYEFTAPQDGTIHLYTTGYTGDMDGYLFTGGCGALLEKDETPNSNIDITYTVSAGNRYTIDLYAYSGNSDYTVYIEYLPATVWIKNATNTSAYTDPSPYTNNTDATTTLSIAGASGLSVTIQGSVEYQDSCIWDYVRITDANGNDRTFCGNIHETYTVSGDTVTLYFHSDYAETDSGVTVSISTLNADARDDSYTTPLDTALNVDATNGMLSNDVGDGLQIINMDLSTLAGTINTYDASTGSFTFTPDTGFYGVTSFTYTIEDASGHIDTATVSIDVNIQTTYHEGTRSFELVNPESTRNIIGNYIILGNTVECVTTYTSSWGGPCTDSPDYNDNNYMTSYIDIDNDSTTWNSSSANFTLPDSYDQQGGNGILWAGLFWQGAINNYHTNYPQRRAYISGDAVVYKDVTRDEDIDLTSTDGNKILLKVDGDTDYTSITAQRFDYDLTFNQYGGYYAAFADITYLLKSKNLSQGDHTITVANLTSNEGREPNIGDIGGWSLVVIYAEDMLVGKPRNVSIYNGYTVIPNEQEVKIEGFKLPKAGDVEAQFSVFAGEGEYIYGTPSGRVDQMLIKQTSSSSGDSMPGAEDPNNIFDAKIAGIDRNSENDNDVSNLNGIDIDTYDVSEILTRYRNSDPNTNSLYINLKSTQDYVTPSMMSFSTELYQPNLCYDYTLEVGGYVIPSENNEIDTTIGAYTNDPMVTRVSLQSQEGDFDFHDVNMTYQIADINHTQYIPGSTEIAKNNQYAYVDASGQTIDETSKGFLIYLGEGASGSGGGTIKPYEKRFIKWKNQIDSNVNTQFSLVVQYTVDYGSGPVPIAKILTENDYCRDGGGYFIASDIFNVASANANLNTGQPYNLYTQVANKPFNVTVFSHDIDHINDDHRLTAADTAVEVEIYDAEWFPRDVNLSCLTPDSNKSAPIFVDFQNQTNKSLSNFSINQAIGNAGFRIWYLHRLDGSLISHHCTDRDDQSCFKAVWETELEADAPSDRNCTTACNASSGCYSCLRKYYGQPVCSKDNFAIRPEAFVVQLRDNQQKTQASATPVINIAHSVTQNQANAVAGYLYRFDINATNYLNDLPTKGYYRTFDNKSTDYVSKMQLKNRDTLISENNCNDFNDKPVEFTVFNGTNINYFQNISEQGQLEQVGLYEFNLTDSNWTIVDWHAQKTVHHNAPGFDNTNTDCIMNSGAVTSDGTARVGCDIQNIHTHPNGRQYQALEVNFYPYQFRTALSFSAELAPVNMVYMNTINPAKIVPAAYQNIPDQNMSYNIVGEFAATGYDGNETLSNFVNGCFARDVTMLFRHQYLSPLPDATTENIGFAYDLVDMNKTDTSIIVLPRKRVDSNLTNYGTNYVMKDLPVLQDGNISFAKDMKGSIYMDLGFNFDRTINQPLNPRLIQVSDFNLTLTNQPATLNVDTITNYKVATNIHVDQNITFAYARAKAGKYFYDDVTANSVTTPISVEVYCDLGFNLCAQRGIDVINGQTSDARWWKVVAHDNVGRNDGRIALQVDNSSATVSSPVLISNSNGQDNTVAVGYTGSDRPAIVNVTHVLPPAVNYTDLWLIYNEFNANTAPNPFYRVRFIDNAVWSGVGKTGNVVGTGAASKKTQRMDW